VPLPIGAELREFGAREKHCWTLLFLLIETRRESTVCGGGGHA